MNIWGKLVPRLLVMLGDVAEIHVSSIKDQLSSYQWIIRIPTTPNVYFRRKQTT